MRSEHEPPLVTPRLELHHLEARDLETLYDSPDDTSVCERLGVTNPHRVLVDEDEILFRRLSQVREDPSVSRWLIRLIVLRESRLAIGSTSFHGPPNEEGVLEIGLGLHEAFRGEGYGTESVRAMWTWAVAQPQVRTLRYCVSRENAPSVRLINGFKFHLVGQQIDEKDGPEDIYELAVVDYRP